MHVATLLRRAKAIIQTEGLGALLMRVRRRLTQPTGRGTRALGSMFGKVDLLQSYEFVLTRDAGSLGENVNSVDRRTINWFVTDFLIGSGGHLNICRYIAMLEERGYTNTICIVGEHRHSSPEKARALISEHFFPIKAAIVFGAANLPPAYFSFATTWGSAYALRGFKDTVRKLYFVQDYEPAFYAYGSEYDFAEATYRFGFTGICAGNWLAQKLAADYGMSCHALGFSFDVDLYTQRPRIDSGVRVFCYCRPSTVRRGLETALLALDLVGQALPDVEFVFAGADMGAYRFPHKHVNAGAVSLEELPDLYSQCDAALVISFTNLSLLPLELMACGCAVVSNRGANTEWLLNDSNSVLSDSAPAAIAEAMVSILRDSGRRAELIARAKAVAHSTSWDAEGDRLRAILEQLALDRSGAGSHMA